MKKAFALLITLVIFSSFTTKDHESYLSVTEIDYNQEQKSIQIVSRVFINDFEDVLSKRYQKDISLSYKADLEKNKEIIARYLDKKLVVTVDGKQRKLNFLGSKFDADQLVLFIESQNVESFGKVKVENLILTDLFDAQKNIVHVRKGDDIESMLLTKGNNNKTVNF
ncbi:MAG: DUF6702 family protein [Christiangramia sp.]